MAKRISKRRWRVVIVDDHPVVREGIRICLKDLRDIDMVGEAMDGAEALKVVAESRPDVVLLDLVMPRMDGLEALPGIRRAAPQARVIVFTFHNSLEHVQAALAAHVDGYLLKDSSPREYIEAIRKVMAGKFFVSRGAEKYLTAKRTVGTGSRFGLTPRQFEYLSMAARGDRPVQIAQAMGCTLATVRTYRKSVLKKLGLENMAGLTRFALEKGL